MSPRQAGAYRTLRWRRLRRSVLEAAGWRCSRCGGAGRLEAHHLVPTAAGGPMWDRGNLAALCRTCHIDEHLRTETAAWKRRRQGEGV